LLFCGENNFVFMNEIQVKSEKQEVEGKKVRDFTDTSFHKYWICSVFIRLDFYGYEDQDRPRFGQAQIPAYGNSKNRGVLPVPFS